MAALTASSVALKYIKYITQENQQYVEMQLKILNFSKE